jgi:integrase
LIDKPIRFGPGFKRPSKKTIRLQRAKSGKRQFEADEIHAMLDKAGPQLRAMILLGVNCGFGNTDVASLPLKALDLEKGWANFPRPKTGIERRAKLWPETISAIRKALDLRAKPKDEADVDRLFLTRFGTAWVKVSTKEVEKEVDGERKKILKVVPDDSVTKEMRKLLKSLDINGHRNFYTLRHVFATIAGGSRDQPAVDHVMGHADDSMPANYRHDIGDDRLEAVAEHVRRWLFPPASESPNVIPMAMRKQA